VFNQDVPAFKGSYNREGQFSVETRPGHRYEIFNLTAQERTNGMQRHFSAVQEIMKRQLHTETFDEMGEPTQDCKRIIGRVVAFSPEDPKISMLNLGLINFDEEYQCGVYKIKLSMSEVQNFSVFEGEVIVVEGFSDANFSTLNVVRMHKPLALRPEPSLSFE